MEFIAEASTELQTPKILNRNNSNKAIFRQVVQSADDINQNRRKYPRDVLSEAMKTCEPLISRKALLGELDHPASSSDSVANSQRQTTVSLENVSHIIRSYDFVGNDLVCEIETTSTPKGAILLGLIKDKAGIGMSMRGLAELRRENDYNVVTSPLTIISFDAVSRPSHVGAVINFNEMRFESTMLTESAGHICVNGKCFLPDHFDRLVESKMITFLNRWV